MSIGGVPAAASFHALMTMHEVVIRTDFGHRSKAPEASGGTQAIQDLFIVFAKHTVGRFAAEGGAANLDEGITGEAVGCVGHSRFSLPFA